MNKSIAPAETHTEKVPYSFSTPENKGVMFNIGNTDILFYLDFEDENLKVVFPPEGFDGYELYGYSVDFNVSADYDFLSGFIDNIGGIDLNVEDSTLRYTGVQVAELLSYTVETDDLTRQIVIQILKKIGAEGIDEEAFWLIAETCKTDLTVPDCYPWFRYIKRLCANGNIIN